MAPRILTPILGFVLVALGLNVGRLLLRKFNKASSHGEWKIDAESTKSCWGGGGRRCCRTTHRPAYICPATSCMPLVHDTSCIHANCAAQRDGLTCLQLVCFVNAYACNSCKIIQCQRCKIKERLWTTLATACPPPLPLQTTYYRREFMSF